MLPNQGVYSLEFKGYYMTLGIDPDAEAIDIKAAHHRVTIAQS